MKRLWGSMGGRCQDGDDVVGGMVRTEGLRLVDGKGNGWEETKVPGTPTLHQTLK